MSNTKFFNDAVAEAKEIRETALANAKLALEEAFTPQIQSMLETAAVLGLYASTSQCDKWINDLTKGELSDQKANRISMELTDLLNSHSSEDFDTKTARLFISHFDNKTANFFDVVQTISLMKGVSMFNEDIVGKQFTSPHFIHSKIKKYYAAEIANSYIEKEGSKDNTADIVICNRSADDAIKAVSNEKITYNADSGLCYSEDSDLKFFQVSLKKARDGAQLGKITSIVMSRYNLPNNIDLADIIIGEGIVNKITTGIKNLVGKTKELFKRVWTQINMWTTIHFNLLQKYADSQDMYVRLLLNSIGIVEDSLLEAKTGLNKTILGLDKSQFVKIAEQINDRVSNLGTVAKKHPFIVSSIGKKLTTQKHPFKKSERFKIVANYVGLLAIEKMLKIPTTTAQELVDEIVHLQQEMFFGKSTLPLYKVFGAGLDGQKSYQYLGGSKEFGKAKENSLEGTNHPLIGIKIVDQKKRYYTLSVHMIAGIDEEGNPSYNKINFRTKAADSFTFAVEGESVLNYKQFKKVYK